MSDDIEDLLLEIGDLAKKASSSDYQYGIKKLRAWRDLALSKLPFREGDRVAIADSWCGPGEGGWWPEREWMRPGQTGVAQRIEIIPDRLHLYAVTRFDTEWEISEWPKGTWHRHNQMLDYDGVTPKDCRHVFYFPVEHLRAATADDRPFPFPVDAPFGAVSR